jgi:hypothetical protein
MYTHHLNFCNVTVLCGHGGRMAPCPHHLPCLRNNARLFTHLFRRPLVLIILCLPLLAQCLPSSSWRCAFRPFGLLADFSLSHPSLTSLKLLLPLLPSGLVTNRTSLNMLRYLASFTRFKLFLCDACCILYSSSFSFLSFISSSTIMHTRRYVA